MKKTLIIKKAQSMMWFYTYNDNTKHDKMMARRWQKSMIFAMYGLNEAINWEI